MSTTHARYFVGALLAMGMALTLVMPSVLGVTLVQDAHAQATTTTTTGGALTPDQMFGGGDVSGSEFAGTAGLGSGSLPKTIASIINVIIGFLGIVAVVIMLLGGFKWMTAGGNDDKVKEAKKLMIAGVIGLVIVLSSFSIAQFVLGQVYTASTTV